MKEIWKDIEGYEDLYSISNLGNVFIKKRNRQKIKTINKDGYYVVTLSKNDKKKSWLVHRLVADAFLNKKKYKKYSNEKHDILTINHKNHNKLSVKNLEWCTNIYNLKYEYITNYRKNYKKIVFKIMEYIDNENIPPKIKNDIYNLIF